MIKIIKKNKFEKKLITHNQNYFKEVILKDCVIPGLLQFAKAKFNLGDKIEEHFHESMNEVFYIISGRFKIFCDDAEKIAEVGDSIVIPPRHKHSFCFIEKTELVYFNIPQF